MLPAPQEERQARGQVHVAHSSERGGRNVRRTALQTKQKRRRDEDAFERPLNTGIEVRHLAAGPVQVEQGPNILVAHRAPIGATSQRGENLPGARVLVGRTGGPARENQPPAERIAGPGGVVRPADVDVIEGPWRTPDRRSGNATRPGNALASSPRRLPRSVSRTRRRPHACRPWRQGSQERGGPPAGPVFDSHRGTRFYQTLRDQPALMPL